MKFIAHSTVPLLALLLALPGKAIQIDFDNGYSPTGGNGGAGNLLDQPATGTKWTCSSPTAVGLVVTAKDGATASDQAIQTHALTDPGFADYGFTPSDADLGAPFNAASSIIKYSFHVKLENAPNTGNGVALRIHLGGGKVGGFDLLCNGCFAVGIGKGDGTKGTVYATTSEGGTDRFQAAANTYFTVAGTINYATKTFTASVNGVTVKSNGSADLGFLDTSSDSARFDLFVINTADTNWIPTAIDNLSFEAEKQP